MTTADFVFGVETLPERAEKYVAATANMITGGGAANAAIAIARQQGSATLAARIGDDWIGEAILQTLLDENIDCSHVKICKHAKTSFSSILIDSAGERQIVNFRGEGLNEKPDWLTNDVPPKFRTIEQEKPTFDGVLTDTRWTAGAIAALEMARRIGVPGVVDAEAPISDRVLESASHVAFSKQGLTAYTDIENTEEALYAANAKLATWFCVTDGGNGVTHLQDGKIHHTPTQVVPVTDTLGAGDVWHGVFTLCLCEGQTEQNAIEFANAAATLKCTGFYGGMAAPTREQTLEFLRKNS
jgi:sulfofructose kinase